MCVFVGAHDRMASCLLDDAAALLACDTGMCEKTPRRIFFVHRLSPPPPDLNVESAWLKGSGSEVRNKRLVYVRAFVVPKWRFNIEIGGEGGIANRREFQTRRFFCTYRAQDLLFSLAAIETSQLIRAVCNLIRADLSWTSVQMAPRMAT